MTTVETIVGAYVGMTVRDGVGAMVGSTVGAVDGAMVGSTVVGAIVGNSVGLYAKVGDAEGNFLNSRTDVP